MTDQQSDTSMAPKSGNGRGEYSLALQAWAMEWDSATPAPFVPSGDTPPSADQESNTATGAWDKFPQPRGWSMQWDGASIAAIQEFYSRVVPPTDTNAETDTPLSQ